MILQAKHLTVDYGHTRAIDDVNFYVNENEILILMGPNGAGKSTVLKSMFGIAPLSKGEIFLYGKSIKPNPRSMIKHKIVYVSQEHRVFSQMTVEENLRMGLFMENDKNIIQERLESVLSFFPVLKKKYKDIAFNMSGGEQQILSLGRALMQEPRVLMLDEPSIGLAPKIVQEVFEKIAHINQTFGTSIIIVEHNLKSLMKIAHRGYILAEGKVLVEGDMEKISKSDMLEKVFFGELA